MNKTNKQVVPRVTIVTDILKNHKGRFITIANIKKDGSFRKFNGRFGVHKGITGAGMKYDPATMGYQTIAEIIKLRDNNGRIYSSGYRYKIVNLNTLQKATFNGKTLIAKEARSEYA